MRIRVNSLFMVTRDAVYLVGMAAAGLADVVNIRCLLAASGVLMLAAGFLLLWLGALRETRHLLPVLGRKQLLRRPG